MNGKKIIAAVVVVLCAVAFYFCYWTKTPTYSLGLIQDAVQTHDVVKFQKHVNVNKVIDGVFDSAISAQEEITGQNIRNNLFALRFLAVIKPGIVSELEKEVLRKVEGREATGSKKDYGIVGDSIDNVGESKMQVKDMTVKESKNGLAYVDIKAYVPAAEKDMIMTVKMIELEDGTWCVEEITNMTEILVELDRIKKQQASQQ